MYAVLLSYCSNPTESRMSNTRGRKESSAADIHDTFVANKGAKHTRHNLRNTAAWTMVDILAPAFPILNVDKATGSSPWRSLRVYDLALNSR